MKKPTCEMCGSTELLKQDNVFVCQICGTKYSVEEARKLLLEDKSEEDETIIDNASKNLTELFELARKEKYDNNAEKAHMYYNQIFEICPSNWEAKFYTVYYESLNCKYDETQTVAVKIVECQREVLKCIKDTITNEDKQKDAIYVMLIELSSLSKKMFINTQNYFNSLSDLQKHDPAIHIHYLMYIDSPGCILLRFGEDVINIFGEKYINDILPCWKQAIQQTLSDKELASSNFAKETLDEWIPKIQKYDPTYQKPQITPASKSIGGCYVATAVYGSYDCPQVWTLRRYRDYTLAETWHGRAFIRTYYAISPTLVKWFGKTKWFKKMWQGKLDRMVEKLNSEGVENTPYEDREW